MTHDRLKTDSMPLSHAFLAFTLGVLRAGVTEVLQSLQEQGAIRSSRGKIEVVDRPGLQELSCECYRSVQHVYERLLS